MELLYISFADVCSGDHVCELRWAAILGDVEKLSELRQLPGFDVNAVNSLDGWTALMMAAWMGQTEFVRRLLDDDEIIINKHSNAGKTALDIARFYNRQEIVRLLEGEQLNNIQFY